MRRFATTRSLIAALVIVAGILGWYAYPVSADENTTGEAQTVAEAQYLVLAHPGRNVPLESFQAMLNDMAAKGYEFDDWLYRGSSQTPDMIFKKK